MNDPEFEFHHKQVDGTELRVYKQITKDCTIDEPYAWILVPRYCLLVWNEKRKR